MEPNKVSKKLLERLLIYLNHLKAMPEQSETVSATVLAKALGLGEVQVRKDLAKISGTGRRRTGRSREQLIRDIERHLELVTQTGTIIVGTGKLSQALLEQDGFAESGLNIMARFDLQPPRDQNDGGKPIYHINRLETFCKYHAVHAGIIAVPPQSAQAVCDCLVACGVRNIWNFASIQLAVPEYVVVRHEHPPVPWTA